MYSAGRGARIGSAAVSKIIELATDDDGWTAEDVKQVEKRYRVKGELGAVEEAVRWDYYISPEEQQGLGKIMSSKNVARLAGGDGKNLSNARLQWFLGHLIFLNHLIFKPEKLGEDAKTHENYVYTICTLGSVDDRRAALEQLLKSGATDINPVARKMLDILNQGNSVQLEATAFRFLMSSGVESVRKNAVLAYVNLAPKLGKELTSQEAIALRELMFVGGENAKAAAARAYAALAPKIEEKEAGLGATALLNLMSNGNKFTKWVATYAYAALAPRIAEKEVMIGSAALRSLMSSDDKDTRLAAVQTYKILAKKIEGAEVELGAITLRGLMSSGDEDIKSAAADAYAALMPEGRKDDNTPKTKFQIYQNYWKEKCAAGTTSDPTAAQKCTDAASLTWTEGFFVICGENRKCENALTATPMQDYTGLEMDQSSAEFKAVRTKLGRVERGENVTDVFKEEGSVSAAAAAPATVAPAPVPAPAAPPPPTPSPPSSDMAAASTGTDEDAETSETNHAKKDEQGSDSPVSKSKKRGKKYYSGLRIGLADGGVYLEPLLGQKLDKTNSTYPNRINDEFVNGFEVEVLHWGDSNLFDTSYAYGGGMRVLFLENPEDPTGYREEADSMFELFLTGSLKFIGDKPISPCLRAELFWPLPDDRGVIIQSRSSGIETGSIDKGLVPFLALGPELLINFDENGRNGLFVNYMWVPRHKWNMKENWSEDGTSLGKYGPGDMVVFGWQRSD